MALGATGLLAIFIAFIVAILLEPLPLPELTVIALAAAVLTRQVTFKQAFVAFSTEVPWLVLTAMWLAQAIRITGLGQRIGFIMVSTFGRTPLLLAYALVIGEFVLAPAIPSVTPRSGGLILPVAIACAEACGSYGQGDPSARHIGAYLVTVLYHTSAVSSGSFLTGNQPNLLTTQLAFTTLKVELTWTGWAAAAAVPAAISIGILPLFIYWLYPPKAQVCGEAQAAARAALRAMGPLTSQEWTMLWVMLLTVTLWVLGGFFVISVVGSAMVGLSVLFFAQILSWKHCLECTQAWTMFIWFGGVLGLATQLSEQGVFDSVADSAKSHLGRLPWTLVFAGLFLLYYYLHYMFASNSAHIAALFPNFALLMTSAGAPAPLVAYSLGIGSNLMGTLTTYGMTHGPLYYETGYVPKSKFYELGILVSLLHLAVFGGVGMAWWKVLGLW